MLRAFPATLWPSGWWWLVVAGTHDGELTENRDPKFAPRTRDDHATSLQSKWWYQDRRRRRRRRRWR
uniref:Putative secreted protein n=1 Tax=Anopheles darlingi TaxID=43151 RepID=A0A2M4DB18_ANODA